MRDERGKMKEERATDYIRRDLEDLTVKDLLELLRSQPDGAGEVMPYNSNAKKLEMLKKELDRYLTVPASARGKMKDKSAVELSQLWHAEAQIQDLLQDQGKLTPETEALFRKHFQAIEDDFNRVSGAKAARGEMKEERANFIEKCLALTKDGSRVLIITKRDKEIIREMMFTYSGSREDPAILLDAASYIKSLNLFFLEDHDTISEVISELEPEVILFDDNYFSKRRKGR